MVIFSRGFWDSTSCVEELVEIVKLAEDQQIGYLPVFMYSTHEEVRTAALEERGKKFAEQVDWLGIICHACDYSRPAGKAHAKAQVQVCGCTQDGLFPQVCRRTGVRHKGERLDGRDKVVQQTISDVCAALADMLQLRWGSSLTRYCSSQCSKCRQIQTSQLLRSQTLRSTCCPIQAVRCAIADGTLRCVDPGRHSG